MVRALILADLHYDFWVDAGRNPFEGLSKELSNVDAVLLAGDVSNKPKVRWRPAFRWVREAIPNARIHVFPGNHDFYDHVIDGERRLSEIADLEKVDYVQTKTLQIGAARLLCATMWTDFMLTDRGAKTGWAAQQKMNDYRKIRVASAQYRKLEPADTVLRHKEHLRWLQQELKKPFAGKTYIVTHHAPHPSVLRYEPKDILGAYASDLSEVVNQHRPDYWLFGHSHDARDVQIAETKLRCVALGYPDAIANPGERVRKALFDL